MMPKENTRIKNDSTKNIELQSLLDAIKNNENSVAENIITNNPNILKNDRLYEIISCAVELKRMPIAKYIIEKEPKNLKAKILGTDYINNLGKNNDMKTLEFIKTLANNLDVGKDNKEREKILKRCNKNINIANRKPDSLKTDLRTLKKKIKNNIPEVAAEIHDFDKGEAEINSLSGEVEIFFDSPERTP